MPETSPDPVLDDVAERLTAYDVAMGDEALRAEAEALRGAVADGTITPAELGGIPPKELDAAYVGAVRLLELGKPAKALKVLGTLIYADPHQGRFFTLAGVTLQRLSQFALADRYYDLALAIDPNDASAWLYRGEVRLHLGERDAGRLMLARGLALAGDRSELRRVARRARAIAKSHGLGDDDLTWAPGDAPQP